MEYSFSFTPVFDNAAVFCRGIGTTLILTAAGSVCGLMLGIAGAVARWWRTPLWQRVVAGYVECIRNTPFLVQLYFVFFGLPSLGLRLSGWQAALLPITLNLGAYSTEILRAGLESLPRGLGEAGAALGMSRWQVFRLVQLRPALSSVWPAMVSQITIVMLGTSVCSQIAVPELSSAADLLQARTFRALEIYLVTTLVYLALSLVVRRGLLFAGRRLLARGRPC
ncbi:MAG: amino acid ABC transporter permease [Planctomycetes bacterium]|nr:amino acid ABC transporter permease [Planctomycetota bacterium]